MVLVLSAIEVIPFCCGGAAVVDRFVGISTSEGESILRLGGYSGAATETGSVLHGVASSTVQQEGVFLSTAGDFLLASKNDLPESSGGTLASSVVCNGSLREFVGLGGSSEKKSAAGGAGDGDASGKKTGQGGGDDDGGNKLDNVIVTGGPVGVKAHSISVIAAGSGAATDAKAFLKGGTAGKTAANSPTSDPPTKANPTTAGAGEIQVKTSSGDVTLDIGGNLSMSADEVTFTGASHYFNNHKAASVSLTKKWQEENVLGLAQDLSPLNISGILLLRARIRHFDTKICIQEQNLVITAADVYMKKLETKSFTSALKNAITQGCFFRSDYSAPVSFRQGRLKIAAPIIESRMEALGISKVDLVTAYVEDVVL